LGKEETEDSWSMPGSGVFDLFAGREALDFKWKMPNKVSGKNVKLDRERGKNE
jgi:hypothetical protein